VTWYELLGTSIPFVLQKRADGGFEARPLRPYVKLEATTMKTEYNSFPLLMYSPNSRGKYAFSHHQDFSSMNHLWGGHIEYS
jgi:hypothetical protein